MSHRRALTLSVALTILLAAGIVLGRDQLFHATSGQSGPAPSPLPALAPWVSTSGDRQILEITLPSVPGASVEREDDESSFARAIQNQLRSRFDDREGEEREWDDDDHDDDDRWEHDDDD